MQPFNHPKQHTKSP